MERVNLGQGTLTANQTFIEYVRKKRPDITKLDIQKMFEQSIELTQIHNKLIKQNKKLQKQYNKVQQSKIQRQQFISTVQKIVKQKSASEDIFKNANSSNSSWLVFKLHKKIESLKINITQKDSVILKLRLSKQNQMLYRKQIQLECLNQIADQFHEQQEQQQKDINNKNNKNYRFEIDSDDDQLPIHKKQNDIIKNIVWMQDHLKSQQETLQQLEAELQYQQRNTKKIMLKSAKKKNQLKRLKQIVREYNTTQQNYKLEKKKKQQKIVGNKNYLGTLMKERDQELEKMQQLKRKQELIQEQEREQIQKLQNKLNELRQFYKSNKLEVNQFKQQIKEPPLDQRKQEWVKRVSLDQVRSIARNMNYSLRLRGVSQKQWIQLFFKDTASEYSIGNILDKLKSYPFQWQNHQQCKLIARYVVQDQDQGYMLQNLKTSQSAPIIKSILMKLIGQITIYPAPIIKQYNAVIGQKLSKFSTLVQQAIQLKQGYIPLLNEDKLKEGIELAQLDFNASQIEYITLYLYGISRNIEKLDIKKLSKMNEIGISWQKQIQRQQQQQQNKQNNSEKYSEEQ